jgi:two-component system cell cycle response regulator
VNHQQVHNTQLKFLLIEDNPGDADFVKELLSDVTDLRIDLEHMTRLSDAEGPLSKGDIDLILLDLSLPDSHGLETLSNVRKRNPEIPIVVLTGRNDNEIALQAVRMGAQDYLLKETINRDMLFRVIRYAIERKGLERELRDSDLQVRRIIEKNADSIIIVDAQGVVLFANPASESLLGRDAERLLGEPFGSPMCGNETTEMNLVKPDGQYLTAEMRVVQIDWKGEDAYLLSLRDITDRKRMEQALENTNQDLKALVDQLKEANQKILDQQKAVIEEERLKVLLQMAGATAHDLNQPLMTLLGNIDLMRLCKNDPEKVQQHIALIEESGCRIADIVKKFQGIRHDKIKPYPSNDIINLEQKIRVLSIEDDEQYFDLLNTLLHKQDRVDLFHASTIEETENLLGRIDFDLILLDHILPDGNSLDILSLIRKSKLEIPVVVITGQGDEMIASRAIQAGAFDYLPKENATAKSLSRAINNALEKGRLKREVSLTMEKMARMSTRDELTGLYNRRYFMEVLNREAARAKRYGTGLVLCMMDLDHFKRINDTYGHSAGDMVLSTVGLMLKESSRESDLVCRYGGEEFVEILPNTKTKDAGIMFERIRNKIREHSFEYNSSRFQISISVGIASFNGTPDLSPHELVEMADKSLYYAKEHGRNRVCCYGTLVRKKKIPELKEMTDVEWTGKSLSFLEDPPPCPPGV